VEQASGGDVYIEKRERIKENINNNNYVVKTIEQRIRSVPSQQTGARRSVASATSWVPLLL
jgi:hypothetical protein